MKYTGEVVASVSYGNPDWFDVVDGGMGATNVTGGSINLPQGGTRQSQAAVIGGTYFEASETGTGIKQEIETTIQSLISADLSEAINSGGFDGAPENIESYETFYTNLAKSRFLVAAGEIADNPDELAAAEQVANSIKVTITVSGLPTTDEIKQDVIDMVKSAFGGV